VLSDLYTLFSVTLAKQVKLACEREKTRERERKRVTMLFDLYNLLWGGYS